MPDWIVNLTTTWPEITIAIVIAVLALLVWLIIKATREGREITFWPPKIGPRHLRSDGMAYNASTDVTLPSPTLTTGVTVPVLDDTATNKSKSAPCSWLDLGAVPIAALFIESGPKNGRWFFVTNMNWRTTVGRAPTCQVPLDGDQRISRSHFLIEFERDYMSEGEVYKFTLVDLSTPNGTIVDGKKADRAIVGHRSLIEVGNVRLRFYVLCDASAQVD